MTQRRSNSYRRTPDIHYKKEPSEWLHLLLFYILPFVVFNGLLFFLVTSRPNCELTVQDTTDYLTTEVTLEIKSLLPVKSVSMSMDTIPFELIRENRRTYKAIIPHNGVVEAEVLSLNGMSSLQFEHVDILDDIPPSLENADINEGIVSMTMSDSQSGIDYSSITATDSFGTAVEAVSLNKDTGAVTFEMPDTGLIVSVSDMAGNEVQGTFSSHLEGEEEQLSQNFSGQSVSSDTSADTTAESTTGNTETSAAGTSDSSAGSTQNSDEEPIIRIE